MKWTRSNNPYERAAFWRNIAIFATVLLVLALVFGVLKGCATGSAKSGEQAMSREETRGRVVTEKVRWGNMPPDQASVFYQLWKEHPPEVPDAR